MKKLLILLCVAALIGAMLSCAAEVSDGWARVDADSEIHQQPASDSVVLISVPRGSELEYLGSTEYDGEQNAWYRVSWKGVTGWINSESATLQWSTLY